MSEKYTATGTVLEVSEVKTFGAKGFQKRELILELPDGKYPQMVAFELSGRNIEFGEGLGIGDNVTVKFNLRGRRYEGDKGVRYFNSLDVWGVEVNSRSGKPQHKTESWPKENAKDTPPDDSDIPF